MAMHGPWCRPADIDFGCGRSRVCYCSSMQPDLPAIQAHDTALFLDVDGTLLEIQERPSDVVASADLKALLERLVPRFGGALSLVSGRSLAEIDRIFAPLGFNAAGAHGSELRLAGDKLAAESVAPMTAAVVARLAAFADTDKGLLLERKHGGVSLHYRGAPALEAGCRAAVERALAELGDDYRLIAGKMVFEIAPRGHDKGEAVRTFLSHAPFKGRKPLFVGDDVTDEDGFRVANELGGTSICVGTKSETLARHALADVTAVRRWLAGFLQ